MSTPTGENQNELPETETHTRDAAITSDLERLEALLAQHEREQWAPQLQRAAQPRPIEGLTRAGKRFDDDDLPQAKSELLMVPPAIMRCRERASRRRRNDVLIALIIGVCVVPIALYFGGGWQPRSETHPQLSSTVTKPATLALPTSLPILAQDDEASPIDDNESASRTKSLHPARFSERLAMVFSKPDDLETGALSPNPAAVRVLDAETIVLLVKQGEQLVEVGDFAAARPLFQPAAQADDAKAALALGATYDPIVFAGRRTVGINADVAKARFWYQKAASLGSAEARRRLDLLANR